MNQVFRCSASLLKQFAAERTLLNGFSTSYWQIWQVVKEKRLKVKLECDS